MRCGASDKAVEETPAVSEPADPRRRLLAQPRQADNFRQICGIRELQSDRTFACRRPSTEPILSGRPRPEFGPLRKCRWRG